MGRIARLMRRLRDNSSGNAMLLMAISMPVLIGGAGLAVDASQWYSWKRELQLATDQAALAAAWSRTNVDTQDSWQTRGLQDYNANLSLVKPFATTPKIQLAGYSNGTDNSVVVNASATKRLSFSSLFLTQAVTVSTHSQASFSKGANYSACLISVGKTGTTFTVGGNANIIAHCGLAALSCSADALTIDGSAHVTTDSIATCGTASVPDDLKDVTNENVDGLTDAFADLTPPTNPTTRSYACAGNGQKAQASPLAGTYAGGLVVKCKTVFGSGIYVINGGTLDLTGNYTVTGTNVMFVLKNGATLKLGGSGNGNTLSLTPMTSSDFLAAGYSQTLSNRYANMLIFEDRNNNPSGDHIINGNSTSLIQGTIYLPAGTARVNGTASLDSSCLQISAKYINILGNAYLDTRCPTADTNSAGGGAAKVRLVA